MAISVAMLAGDKELEERYHNGWCCKGCPEEKYPGSVAQAGQ
jgi:hypothetical protein